MNKDNPILKNDILKLIFTVLLSLALLLTSQSFIVTAFAEDGNDAKETEAAEPAKTDEAADKEQSKGSDAGEKSEQRKEDTSKKDDSSKKEDSSKSDKKSAAKQEEETENGVLEVSSEPSSYTVDFYYTSEDGKTAEYHLKGGSEIMLSELFRILGINRSTADIDNTAFTDNELVKFVKEGDDYRVISLKPFDTSETLTITFKDGEVVMLTVLDATPRNRTPNTDNLINWNLAADGTLTIRATNSAAAANFSVDRTSQAGWDSFWATANGASTTIRDEVTKVVFTTPASGVKIDLNDKGIAYMFAGFTNLESVDFDSAIKGNTNNMAGMFKDCPNLKTIDMTGIAYNDSVLKTDEMFMNCSSLTEITGLDQFVVGKADTMNRMFYGCSSLKKIDLSSMTNNGKLWQFQDFCNGCTSLEEFILNNEDFKTRPGSNSYTTGAAQMQRMFQGCDNLKTIDMSNITINGRDNNWTGFKSIFQGLDKLETIKMNNTKLPYMRDLSGTFANLPSLTTFEMKSDNPGDIAPDAMYMNDMFKSSFTSPAGEGTPTLDVSGLGKLEKIVNMNGFVEGCTGLEVLNIDNLDNSIIGPTNSRHSITPGQSGYIADRGVAAEIGAREFGRALFGVDTNTGRGKSIDGSDSLPKLTTISAKDSNVWMVHNNRGLPGNEYYNAAEVNNIYYFTENKMEFASDAGPTVNIDTNRDYIDLITDRDGTADNMPILNPDIEYPDMTTNINIKDGDLNTNGAGHLAPGVYTIKGEDRDSLGEVSMCDSYYRIAYIGEVPYEVTGIDAGDPELVKVDGGDNTYITTKVMEWPDSGDYTIDRSSNPIVIKYKGAAVDVNGKKSDVIITVTKITFKELDRIPTDPGTDRVPHDGNEYVPTTREYYRPILQANKSDGVQFHNYVRLGDPNTPWNFVNCLSKGSGTDIEFSVSIDGAGEDTSFVFRGEDLDVAENQNWNNSKSDACYDNLPANQNTFGDGGEAFVLGEGNAIGTVKFADHTGLALVDGQKGKTVITTGTDPNTSWSEFTVKANAQGSDYTWTSGIACTTYALRNTKAQNTGAISLQPEALKQLINGSLNADQFEFEMKEVSRDPSNAPGPDISDPTKTNDADGKITFDKMEYKAEDGNDYYPGVDPNTGELNVYTYTYKVHEIIPADAQDIGGCKVKDGIIYDESEHTITVVITPPKNDTEMVRGIKAEIYVDKTPGDGVTPDKTYWHHEKTCVDCNNGSITDVPENTWYDKDGKIIDSPNPFTLSKATFKNVIPETTLRIPVQKILEGRPWEDSDKFAAALAPNGEDVPMPETKKTLDSGEEVAEVIIDNQGKSVKDDKNKVIGYKTAFDDITYTIDDLGKTYNYRVRELTPEEAGIERLSDVTYDTGVYDVNVEVKMDKSDPDNPKFVAVPSYKDENGKTSDIPSFTNKYDKKDKPDDDEDTEDNDNGNGSKKTDNHKVSKNIGTNTGDETNVGIWIGLLIAAIIVAAAIVIIRRRRNNQ